MTDIKEQIEKAADEYSSKFFPTIYWQMSADATYNQCSHMAFQAGAKFVLERAQELVNFAEKYIKECPWPHDEDGCTCDDVKSALAKFRGEV